MRKNTVVMVGIAVVFGLLAVFVAQGWLNYQAELSRRVVAPKEKPVATRTIVIAAGPLRFGTHVNADSLREVAWPDEALPAGTFGSITEVMSGGKRIVLASIEKNEPILRSKITGPGQKATLSAVIQDGMRAVTIRVNDVEGVGGFVLPGDHVDVLATFGSGQPHTERVAEGLEILFVLSARQGSQTGAGPDLGALGSGAGPTMNLIVLVSPDQEERLAYARAVGILDVAIAPAV